MIPELVRIDAMTLAEQTGLTLSYLDTRDRLENIKAFLAIGQEPLTGRRIYSVTFVSAELTRQIGGNAEFLILETRRSLEQEIWNLAPAAQIQMYFRYEEPYWIEWPEGTGFQG